MFLVSRRAEKQEGVVAWAAAEKRCVAYGGHLASFESKEESDFILSLEDDTKQREPPPRSKIGAHLIKCFCRYPPIPCPAAGADHAIVLMCVMLPPCSSFLGRLDRR